MTTLFTEHIQYRSLRPITRENTIGHLSERRLHTRACHLIKRQRLVENEKLGFSYQHLKCLELQIKDFQTEIKSKNKYFEYPSFNINFYHRHHYNFLHRFIALISLSHFQSNILHNLFCLIILSQH